LFESGLSESFFPVKKRKPKSGQFQGSDSVHEENLSTELIFDCTNVSHNKEIYDFFVCEGIEVYPVAG
jgi:hypothetical protein